MNKLEQKRLFGKKTFYLKETEIEIYNKSLSEELEYTIDYLDLGVEKIKKSEISGFVELIFLAFFALEFGMLIYSIVVGAELKELAFWSMASAFFLGMYFIVKFKAKRKLIYLAGGQKGLEFFQEKPSKSEVDKFMDETILRVKQAYKIEYLKWRDGVPFEMKKDRVEWLKRIKIISSEEMNDILKGIELNSGDKSIGFIKD